MKYTILKNKLNSKQQSYLAEKITDLEYTPTPWYGKYDKVTFNETNQDIPPEVLRAVSAIISLTGIEQDFNNIIVKRFGAKDYVESHVDSRNRVGKSVSIVVGNFEKALYRIDDEHVEVNPGDIIVQNCTDGYNMGPHYSMYPLEDGTKYVVTVCTILKENPV